jgi:DICT domain-containing protein
MKPQVAIQLTTNAIVLKETYQRTLTALGHRLVDLLRAATAPAALVVVAVRRLMVMLAAEVAAAGAPHMGLEGEQVAEAIAKAEATQTATSPVSHAVATMPAAELKKFDARNPPRQARTTASPPSLLDFATNFSQKNSSLWESPSTMRSKI